VLCRVKKTTINMKEKNIKKYAEHQILNISDINNENCLKIIKNLINYNRFDDIARIMSDFNLVCSVETYKKIIETINDSDNEKIINDLIRGKLGIFG